MRGITILAVLLSCGTVFGDGKVFAPTATAKVTIPDQEALIHYADGTETLVIETRFVGEGDKFAWIVPTPAEPGVEEVTRGLFPTLRFQLLPTVTHSVPSMWVIVVTLSSVAIWLVLSKRVVWTVLFLLSILLTFTVVLPSLGPPRTLAAGGALEASVDSVHVIDRRIVGDYDVTVVASEDSKALTDWFDEHGFSIDEPSSVVIDEYVQDGWVFSAIELHREADQGGLSTPHPLSFTFQTDQAVYPMKLTGVGNGRCTVDLYVFGAERAEAPGFEVLECHEIAPARHYRGPANKFNVMHPQLVELVPDAGVVTKLSGTFAPGTMSDDAHVNWAPFKRVHRHYYTSLGAGRIALNVLVSTWSFGFLTLYLVTRERKWTPKRAWRGVSATVLLGIILGGGTYLLLPKTEATLKQNPWLLAYMNHSHVANRLGMMADEYDAETIDELWLHDALDRLMQSEKDYLQRFTNPFTGRPMIEEDSPGNYLLRLNMDGRPEYVWFDGDGGERVEPIGWADDQ